MADTTRMTKQQDRAEAVANVPADQVDAWTAQGWVAEKPRRATKAATKDD